MCVLRQEAGRGQRRGRGACLWRCPSCPADSKQWTQRLLADTHPGGQRRAASPRSCRARVPTGENAVFTQGGPFELPTLPQNLGYRSVEKGLELESQGWALRLTFVPCRL